MRIEEVVLWARMQGVLDETLRRVCQDALLVCISRLIQALYREQDYAGATRLERPTSGRWSIVIGSGPTLVAPVSGPLPFHRLDVISLPVYRDVDRTTLIESSDEFLDCLERSVGSYFGPQFADLRADFENSFANLVLNHVLHRLLPADSSPPEPIFEGHLYYPFPALRLGPSLDQISRCSNLSGEPVAVPLVQVNGLDFFSNCFNSWDECVAAWAGGEGVSGSMPVHPWQFETSPVVQSLITLGLLQVCEGHVRGRPLASQRTLRLETGYDVKLPIESTLTGEHRLLYPVNRTNAPFVSALGTSLLAAESPGTLALQPDLASVAYPDPTIGSHVAAVVRDRLPVPEREAVIPALNLWTGLRLADDLLRVDAERAYQVFALYSRVLLEGPVHFYLRWGLAFEPHMQNVLIRVRDCNPVGVVLRDLDGTILDRARVPATLRKFGVRLPLDPWREMPSYDTGGQRLMHAIFYGHLGPIISHLVSFPGVSASVLQAVALEVFDDLVATYSGQERELATKLTAYLGRVKCSLSMRLQRRMDNAFGNAPE